MSISKIDIIRTPHFECLQNQCLHDPSIPFTFNFSPVDLKTKSRDVGDYFLKVMSMSGWMSATHFIIFSYSL